MKKTNYSAIAKDLEIALKTQNKGLRQFSRETGIAPATLSRFIRGLTVASAEVMFTILEFLEKDFRDYRL